MPITMNANQSISHAGNEESALPAHQRGGPARRRWADAVPVRRSPAGLESPRVLQRMPGAPPLRLLAYGETQNISQQTLQKLWTAAPDKVLKKVVSAIHTGNWPALNDLQAWRKSLRTTEKNLRKISMENADRQDAEARDFLEVLGNMVVEQIEVYRSTYGGPVRNYYPKGRG